MRRTQELRVEPWDPSAFTNQENEVDPAKEIKKELLAAVEENQERVTLTLREEIPKGREE